MTIKQLNVTASLPRHFTVICEGELTVISGLPLYRLIFPGMGLRTRRGYDGSLLA